MLYLEDFLEVIENVPQEVRDRTTELRELDLGIQNNRDQLEDKIKNFFSTAKKTKVQERQVAYEKIRNDYYKLLDDADEKSNIATNMADSVDRYIRKLDQEIEKFKYELEADNPGITETLEKRSLELDEPIKDSQKENRYKNHHGSRSSDWRVPIKREDSFANLNSSPPQSLSFNLAQIGTGGLGVGNSPSLGTGPQSRRSSSIKSYDPLSPGFLSSQFSLSTDLLNSSSDLLSGTSNIPSLSAAAGLGSSLSSALAGVSSGSIKNSSSSQSSSNKRQKKKQNSTSAANTSTAPNADTLLSAMADDSIAETAALESPDWSYDPNEPRYCICNQVSYGDMVACDNTRCTVEWFHYPCVGMTDPPKGKWYCPQCSASMNRRQRK